AGRVRAAGQGGGVGDLAAQRHPRRRLGREGRVAGAGRDYHRLGRVVAGGGDGVVVGVTRVGGDPPIGSGLGGCEQVGLVLAVAAGGLGRCGGGARARRVVGTVERERDRACRVVATREGGDIEDLTTDQHTRRRLGRQRGSDLRGTTEDGGDILALIG